MTPEPQDAVYHDVHGLRIEYISQAADQKYHLYLLGDEPGEHLVLYLWDPAVINGIPVLDGVLNFPDPVTVIRQGESLFTIQST